MKKIILAYIVLLSGITTNAQTGHYAEVNGTKIYYEMYGEGEPLLLLHGFTVSHIVWDDLVKDLSKNYKLIIPDLRGHGNSTNP
ncbi:MAG: alpha/beta fold hydrolase, partial [Saprospiraceae bacterium]